LKLHDDFIIKVLPKDAAVTSVLDFEYTADGRPRNETFVLYLVIGLLIKVSRYRKDQAKDVCLSLQRWLSYVKKN
jgi:hypothetical protein